MPRYAGQERRLARVEAQLLMLAVYRSPREILFGAGQRRSLAHYASDLGTRAFFCVDPFLSDGEAFRTLLADLQAAGIETYTHAEVTPELPIESIESSVTAAREFGADLFIALGGGSCIDLAKMTAALVTHGGGVRDYYGEFKVPGPLLPVIAIPTTAGTGSEVTPVAVLTDTDRETKVGVSSPHLIPALAICDPELTISCPPQVTASSGADALSHAIEAFTAVERDGTATLTHERVFVGSTRLTDTLALEAIENLVASLERSYTQPADVEARASTMYGSLLAGLAFGTAGTAAAHALQYPVGAVTQTPHGVGVGTLLPYVMEYNRPERQERLARIAELFGATGADTPALAAQAPALVRDLLSRVGIPSSLEELGFDRTRIEWAAEQSVLAVRLSENNPRQLDTAAARNILKAAFAGDLDRVHSGEEHRHTVVTNPALSAGTK